jgi:hypothetical protein
MMVSSILIRVVPRRYFPTPGIDDGRVIIIDGDVFEHATADGVLDACADQDVER